MTHYPYPTDLMRCMDRLNSRLAHPHARAKLRACLDLDNPAFRIRIQHLLALGIKGEATPSGMIDFPWARLYANYPLSYSLVITPLTDAPAVVYYQVAQTQWGCMLLAAVPQGLCEVHFCNETPITVLTTQLLRYYPGAHLLCMMHTHIRTALAYLTWPRCAQPTSLHHALRGTPFQQSVWTALANIPLGGYVSYQELATQIGRTSALRAVGTAVGHNPLAVILPCHRVRRLNGQLGQYHYGQTFKIALLAWEEWISTLHEEV